MRTLLTAAVAVVVTAVLFLLMQALIKDPIVVAVDPPAVPPVGRVEAPVEPEPEETNETPPPLEPPPGIDGEPVLIPLENAVVDFDEPMPRGFGEGETSMCRFRKAMTRFRSSPSRRNTHMTS